MTSEKENFMQEARILARRAWGLLVYAGEESLSAEFDQLCKVIANKIDHEDHEDHED